MTADRFRRIDEIYSQAIALEGEDRQRLVDRESGEDTALRDSVISLMEAGERAGDFLERPLLDYQSSRLGPWRVVRELGRGGMGLVYLGERADGQYEQQVAIKITTTAVNAETRLLARLQHANIARLLDAGETPSGFPYLVMELVEGVPLDAWIERVKPALRERLQVFQTICGAVHYAHQNLVLHRDLKPSNLLVTGAGVPKLLDFGIAKPMEEGSETATQAPAFSVDYASPEQIQGIPLTTASDVYALGALLHLMISGRPPRTFAGKMFREVFDELTSKEPVSAIGGDLGQIIRKATRLDPGQRYASAADLASDVQRYLDGRPVAAQPPTFAYLARRYLSRHRWEIAVAGLVFVALSATAGFALWQARTADRRFQQVRRLARSVLFELHDGIEPLPGSNPVRRLLTERALEYLEALSKEAGRDTSLLREIAEGYMRLGDVQGGPAVRNLGLYAEANASFRKAHELAQTLRDAMPGDAAAWLLMLRSERPILQADLAGKQREDALLRIEKHFASAQQLKQRVATHATLRIAADAQALRAMGYLYNAKPEALDQYLKALAGYEALPASTVEERSKTSGMHQFLADEFQRRGNFDEALRHIEAAIRIQEDTLRLHPLSFQARLDVTKGRQQLGSFYLARKRAADAVTQFHAVAEVREQLMAQEPSDVVTKAWLAQSYSLLGLAQTGSGKTADAVAALTKGVAVYRSLAQVEKNSQRVQLALADAIGALGDANWRAGRKREACEAYADADSRYRQIVRTAVSASLQSGAPKRVAQALAERCAAR